MKWETQDIVVMVLIGLVAGWLASLLVGGGGLIRYIITGLIGSFVGTVLVRATGFKVGVGNALVDQIIVSTIGAIVVVLLARLVA